VLSIIKAANVGFKICRGANFRRLRTKSPRHLTYVEPSENETLSAMPVACFMQSPVDTP
jgi:hypothetical protein